MNTTPTPLTASYEREHYESMLRHIAANADRHPWYGPCDAQGEGGSCCECNRLVSIALALEARNAELVEALKPILKFIKAFDAKPISGLHDEFYSIHLGTEYEGVLRLSDLRLIQALAGQEGGQG